MTTAAEIMNRDFYFASPTDASGALLQEMGMRGVGTVVVLDLAGRPVGMATAGEVESCHDMEELAETLTRPALCMDQCSPIDVAARTLALHDSDCLLLLNEHGIAVGTLSSHELLRSVLGLNDTHAALQRGERDERWEEAELLELGAVHRAPEAPGIVLLSLGVDATGRRIVWAEATPNMRERLDHMLLKPQTDPRLEAMLDAYPRTLRFRCLTVYDADQRETLATALCNVDAGQPAPRTPRTSGVTAAVEHDLAANADAER